MKKIYALLFLFLSLTGSAAFSQSGILDATFGNGGKVVTPSGLSNSVAQTIAITPDGKILVGGTEIDTVYLGLRLNTGNLLQYNSDGTLDSAFGINGKVSPASVAVSTISTIAQQADGKIIVSGDGGNMIRYNKNGSLDTTFGHYGYISTVYTDSIFFIKKIISEPNGKLLAGGYIIGLTTYPEVVPDVAFAQYLPNGVLDSSFGNNGMIKKEGQRVAGQYKTGGINDMAIMPSGKIVAVIDQLPEIFGTGDFLMYQFLPNGAIDSTFGINGILRTDVDSLSYDIAYGIVALPDSSFAVCGSSYQSVYDPVADTSYSASGIAIIKYHPDGSFDSTFGTNGKVFTLPLPNKSVYGNYILSSSDGSLFVSGSTSYGYPNFDFLVAKYHSNGSLDSSFGTNGITTTDFAGHNDISYSSALQPDGKIILVGQETDSTSYNIALARYNNAIIYPLHLLSFTATKNNAVNLLQWQTAQETNTSLFEVQRSSNGKEYSSIGYVNAGSRLYHFTDNNPFNGNNYYRLKMIDKNGSFTYSPVRIITSTNAFTVKVYPNPVKENLQLQITSDKESTLQWSILSADGKILLSGQWNVPAGSSAKEIRLTSLQKGTYFLSSATTGKSPAINKIEKL